MKPDPDALTEMERLLLMAAADHGLGPDTDLSYANCARVVARVLLWEGLVNDEILAAWAEFEYHPAITTCYGALIALIQHQPSSEALFEGQGNLGTPESPGAFPHFTSCRLTCIGQEIAEQLLREHPEHRNPTAPESD